MKNLLLILFICSGFLGFSQTDTIPSPSNTISFDLISEYYESGLLKSKGKKDDKKRKTGVWREFYESGNLKEQGRYFEGKINGPWSKYYDNGQLKISITYYFGDINGVVNTFWPDGTKKREDVFSRGNFKEGICYNIDGKKIKHFDYQTMPSYPENGIQGLMNYLMKNVTYPSKAKSKGIQGKVYVNFTIEKDGSIQKINIIRGVHSLLDNEALRVINEMPKWIPGTQDGEKVAVKFNLPINFNLK